MNQVRRIVLLAKHLGRYVMGAFIVIGMLIVGGLFGADKASGPAKMPDPVTRSFDWSSKKIIDLDGEIMPENPYGLDVRLVPTKPMMGLFTGPFSAKSFLAKFPEVVSSNKEVLMRINSPGGSVAEMIVIANKMHEEQSRGVKFICMVDGIAASAATYIYSQCDERYATTRSRILWHSAATGFQGIIKAQTAHAIADSLDAINSMWDDMRPYFSKDYFDVNFEQENLISALEVESASKYAFLRTIDSFAYTSEKNSIIINIEIEQ